MYNPVQNHMRNRNVQIGNICSQFAHLELLLAQAIWSALGLTEEAGLSVTGSLNVEARARLAVELCEKQGKPKQVVDELRRVRTIQGHRFPNPDDPASEFVVVHRGKDAGVKLKRTDAELAQIGKDIADLHQPLFAVMADVGMTY